MIDSDVENTLHKIAKLIFNHIENGQISVINNDTGLYSGHTGILFFLTHYVNYFSVNNKIQCNYDKYITLLLDKLKNGVSLYTYSSGLSGMLSAYRLLNKGNMLNIDYSDFEVGYYNSMLIRMNHDIINGNYDFMHGGLGPALFYHNNESYIEKTVKTLNNTAIIDGKKYKWKCGLKYSDGNFNISLSHGISSIVIYLSRIYHCGIMQEQINELINGAVTYILSQEVDYEKHGCFFPHSSLANNSNRTILYKSRLAWCYGDLGVAAALWQAGKATKKDIWCRKAKEIYTYSATRVGSENTMVADAGLCHGSSGVAMLFKYIYDQTKDQVYFNAYNYWISITLQHNKFPDGFAGYKTFDVNVEKKYKWENKYGFLEGVSGIGMMLLSCLSDVTSRNLNELMLLY